MAVILKDNSNTTKTAVYTKENEIVKSHYTATNLAYLSLVFMGGPSKVIVERVQTENRYGHVVEEGHRVVTGGSTVGRKLNVLQRGIIGISVGGKTKGEKMIEDTVKELNATFEKNAKKLLDDLTSEVEL